ncbi:hypothetical protein PFICI_02440 [Pestalotiopsis fici W106-1]|uniref:Uncharacterized protein n=1 Tax=Pestalotiopsis fici (strain W106-1 / CGMCC3.15140) TaxID=1229662 RepID=W3XED7_PESFW|nr:uncharacterized protein PFICI_02440 [Pestalotiopsis fici W106-1]ETS84415.1 hypothetical protein PFICI_02440 [Pestalotiopsis fici W106-1]
MRGNRFTQPPNEERGPDPETLSRFIHAMNERRIKSLIEGLEDNKRELKEKNRELATEQLVSSNLRTVIDQQKTKVAKLNDENNDLRRALSTVGGQFFRQVKETRSKITEVLDTTQPHTFGTNKFKGQEESSATTATTATDNYQLWYDTIVDPDCSTQELAEQLDCAATLMAMSRGEVLGVCEGAEATQAKPASAVTGDDDHRAPIHVPKKQRRAKKDKNKNGSN